MADQRGQPGALLRALLGPSGDDIGCERCFELLDVYVEAELADEDAERRVPGMRTHLEGCPACAEEHDSLRALLMGSATGAGG
jgi:hypothetical protein